MGLVSVAKQKEITQLKESNSTLHNMCTQYKEQEEVQRQEKHRAVMELQVVKNEHRQIAKIPRDFGEGDEGL